MGDHASPAQLFCALLLFAISYVTANKISDGYVANNKHFKEKCGVNYEENCGKL
jgi:hypothetical protein